MIVVIWIDWYPYHVARFRALAEHHTLSGRMRGIELVGAAGVHAGFVFREKIADSLPVMTLAPDANWHEAGQRRLALAIWRKLEELQPTTVLVPGYYTAPALAAALWCKVRGRRSVLMTESTQADHARTGWKEGLKSLLIRKLFDWAVAGGEAHVRYLEALHFPKNRIARNYDVVDNDFFAKGTDAIRALKSPGEFGLPDSYFLYVGRLAEEKNVDGLLSAFASYRSRGGQWSLVLAGDGPERKNLEQRAQLLGVLDHVVFAGHRKSAELLPYYAFANCFVLPSRREPWGLVVNEAMAAGLPVIVSNRCGCAEDLVRHGINGFSFDPEDNGSLTDCLMAVTAQTEEFLTGMGRISREIVDGYSPREWANEVARIVAA